MRKELEQLILKSGATKVGFAKLEGLYQNVDFDDADNGNSERETFTIPEYPVGVSIVLAYPKEIIRNISKAPTMEYHDAYHDLNARLDKLAVLCSDFLKARGYHAHPQTVASVKEYGIYRTPMPHKTVAVNAGLGWIGKSALFLTEQYGSAIRLTSVLTDAPLECDEATTVSRCNDCNLCERACPAHAISGQNWRPELDRDEFFDAKACRQKAREISAMVLNKTITLCGKCIEICPYTKKYTKD